MIVLNFLINEGKMLNKKNVLIISHDKNGKSKYKIN